MKNFDNLYLEKYMLPDYIPEEDSVPESFMIMFLSYFFKDKFNNMATAMFKEFLVRLEQEYPNNFVYLRKVIDEFPSVVNGMNIYDDIYTAVSIMTAYSYPSNAMCIAITDALINSLKCILDLRGVEVYHDDPSSR